MTDIHRTVSQICTTLCRTVWEAICSFSRKSEESNDHPPDFWNGKNGCDFLFLHDFLNMHFWTVAIFVSIAISGIRYRERGWSIVSGLECPEGTVYLSVFKQNSGSRFNQADESFMIAGYFNSTRRILVRERPLMEFRAKHTYEYCLKRTPSLIYDVVLKDSKEDGWDDGSYVEIRGKDGFLFFKGSCIEGKEEVYRIRSR